MLISLVATNVLFLDEDVCLFPAEGSPVLAELPHSDKVGCAWGEAAGGAEQGVAVMLPPVQTLLDIQFPFYFVLIRNITSVSYLLKAKNT